jgi:SAM-dependent methyltransferase
LEEPVTVTAKPSRALFVATILAGSFLLFLIQPMIARMALPRLGGAPNVWNSAMLIYQALLLAGYFYAHRISQLPFVTQTKLHLGMFAVAALTLPVGLIEMPAPAPGTEVFWVPALLALSIGPVFFLVSAQAPLMQRWFSAHPEAGEPWPLYAASNLGSFGGLIAYPLVVEPLLSLKAQAWAWSAGYALLLVLIALSARSRRGVHQVASPAAPAPPVPARRVLIWLALAAVPSGLMLSTSTHLTTDIFAMPLLWVIPLGIYLLSFVFAFSENRIAAKVISALAWPVLLGAGGLAMVSQGSNGLIPVLISVALLFFVCVALHARLYDLRPATGQLTYFYLIMSAGGALGGLFTALIAPLVFDWVWEHPLLVLAAALLLPRDALPDWRRFRGLEPTMMRAMLLAAAFAIGALLWLLNDITSQFEESSLRWAYAGAIAVLGLFLVPWRALGPALLALTMYVQGGFVTIQDTRDGIRTRSYFGIYTVRDYPEQKLRTLAHGTTLHGEQSLDPKLSRVPLTYYGPGSGAGIAFSHARTLFGPAPAIAVVGLGTGTLACFAQPGETWRFYEIDPAVLELSRNATFTFVRDCTPNAQVVIGDARIELAKVRPGSVDLLAIDAFSSDAIPLHLLTDEAFGVYLDALSPGGVLLVHISNRYIDLEPALSAVVRARGLHAALRDDEPPEGTELTGSSWIAISRDPAQLKAMARLAPALAWTPLKPPAPSVWSDDHASILPFIRWHNFLGRQS